MLGNIFAISELTSLRNFLNKSFSIWQLERDASNEVQWTRSISNQTSPLFGHNSLPLKSAKDFFFSQKDPLFRFDGNTFESMTPETEPFALFGVQACDLTAIAYQDKFFKEDPNYQRRRQAALLVGIDCQSACENGFCPVVNAGPHVRVETADLILHKTESGSWLIIAETEKGKNSIQELDKEDVGLGQLAKRHIQQQRVLKDFANFDYIVNGIDRINRNAVPANVWESLSTHCLECSGCTNLCPTCSCYSTYEEPENSGNGYVTYRTWDSCLFEGFQKEASGNNPSHQAGKRTERFWYHKFSNQFLPEFERYGCVGCGRCEVTCPGSIGAHSVMQRIEQLC